MEGACACAGLWGKNGEIPATPIAIEISCDVGSLSFAARELLAIFSVAFVRDFVEHEGKVAVEGGVCATEAPVFELGETSPAHEEAAEVNCMPGR